MSENKEIQIETSGEDSDSDGDVLDKGASVRLNNSSVHEYFETLNLTKNGKETEGRKCTMCPQTFGNKNPTNLKLHLKRKHSVIWKEVEARDVKARKDLIEERFSRNQPFGRSSSQVKRTAAEALLGVKDKKRQTTLLNMFPSVSSTKSNNLPPRSRAKEELSEQLLGLWVAGSTLPISFIEDPNFHLWVRSYDPQAKVPSARKLARVVNDVTDKIKEKIKAALTNARTVHATTDIWSSLCSSDSYIGVTVHLYNPQTQKRENYRICCRHFPGKHTGQLISSKLMGIFEEFNIANKVKYLVTDNASNMISAARKLNELDNKEEDYMTDGSDCDSDVEESHEEDVGVNSSNDAEIDLLNSSVSEITRLPCIAHKVNICVVNCIEKKQHAFGRSLGKCRLVAKNYRKSPKAKAILKKYHKRRLAGFVKTRWWSDVFCVKSFLDAYQTQMEDGDNAIVKLCDEMDWNIVITERNISDLKEYLSVMEPFEQLFAKLNGETYSTLPKVYPSLKELCELLIQKEREGSAAARSFCSGLKEELEKMFKFVLDSEDEDFNPLYVTTTFLDPFYKFTVAPTMIDAVNDFLKTLVKDSTAEENNIQLRQEEGVSFIIPGLLNLSKNFASSGSVPRLQSSSSVEMKLQKDVELYEMKAKQIVEKAIEVAKKEVSEGGKSVLKPKDPLDIWIKQV